MFWGIMKVEQTVSLFTFTPFSSDEQTNSLFYFLATLYLITFAYLLNWLNQIKFVFICENSWLNIP